MTQNASSAVSGALSKANFLRLAIFATALAVLMGIGLVAPQLARADTENVTPLRTIEGGSSALTIPRGAALSSDKIWVANHGAVGFKSYVNAYLKSDSGGAAPTKQIKGVLFDDKPNLLNPYGVAMDSTNHAGKLWVGNQGDLTTDGTVTVYSGALTGNIAPDATITGVKSARGLAFNSAGDLAVADHGNNAVNIYRNAQITALAGTVALVPDTVISGALTLLDDPTGLVFDGSDNLFVANSGSDSVARFNAGIIAATYSGKPNNLIVGGNTELGSPASVSVDGHGNIWVGNLNTLTSTIAIFSPNANDNATPLHLLKGDNTKLHNPYGLAFDSVGGSGGALAGTTYVVNNANTPIPNNVSAFHDAIVSSVSPTTGPPAGGTRVTIRGTALDDVSNVSFGGSDVAKAKFTSWSSTEIKLDSPAHAPGIVDVVLTTVGGNTTEKDAFTYQGVPAASAAVFGNAQAGQAKVSWTAISPTPYPALMSYTATASPGGASCTTTNNWCTVTGLAAGQDYTFTVTGKNSMGVGPASAASAAVSILIPVGPSANYKPLRRSTRVSWGASPGSTEFQVLMNGREVCKTGATARTCNVPKPYGEKANITVTALSPTGNSAQVAGRYIRPTAVVGFGVVNFRRGSTRITPHQRKKLRNAARQAKAQGFGAVRLDAYSARNNGGGVRARKRLSLRRAKIARKVLTRSVAGITIKIHVRATPRVHRRVGASIGIR